MSNDEHNIDLGFRPQSYFWPHALRTHVLSSIKGAVRREIVAKLFDEGREAEIPADILRSSLDPSLREAVGGIGPAFIGGEYLPDHANDEVEIARIEIASTTRDVIAVYARRRNDHIEYQVVDEYDGDTLGKNKTLVSNQTMTLNELSNFFLGAFDLFEVLRQVADKENPREAALGFYKASSVFYPEFSRLLKLKVVDWLEAGCPYNSDGSFFGLSDEEVEELIKSHSLGKERMK